MLNIFEVLTRLNHKNHQSGQDLADQLKVTRATIHNSISRIEALGIKIERVRGQGYRLFHPLDLLSAKEITAALDVGSANSLEHIECLREVDSTNQYAAQLARPAAGRFSVVLAESQIAGKGRRGREWSSPFAANLYLSLLWPLQKPLHTASVLSPYLALQIARSLTQTGLSSVGVKWPNDIYCDDKKLAGILIECMGELSGHCKMVIGVGLNVYMSRYSQISIDQPWTDLATQMPGTSIERNKIAALLIDSIVEILQLFEQDKLKGLSNEWQPWDIMKDQSISVQSDQGHQDGIARGVDDDGSLVLETMPGKTENIHIGEISIRPSS